MLAACSLSEIMSDLAARLRDPNKLSATIGVILGHTYQVFRPQFLRLPICRTRSTMLSTTGTMKLPRTAVLNEFLLQAALVVTSSALFVAIILVTSATTWAELSSNSHQPLGRWVSTEVGTTLLIVRVLQGLLTAVATAAVCSAFTRLHWRGMSKREGLDLVELIALSPTTLFSGSIRVILSKDSSRSAQIWALVR